MSLKDILLSMVQNSDYALALSNSDGIKVFSFPYTSNLTGGS